MDASVMVIVRLAMAGNIKETSQGYPNEAGEKAYYLNCSSYCLGYFFIDKFADFFDQFTVMNFPCVLLIQRR